MSLSCFFDFDAEEKFEIRWRKFKTPSNTTWNVKEEWIVDTNFDPWNFNECEKERAYFHRISLMTEEVNEYYAEIRISKIDPKGTTEYLSYKMDLNKKSSVKVSLIDYRDLFYTDSVPISLRCTINLFPLFHQGYFQPTQLSDTCTEVQSGRIHSVEAMRNLSMDMKSLLEKGIRSDITLVCGSTEIHVHRNILAVRAPTFAWLHGIPVEETQENKVLICDIDPVVLREMLLFIYSGKALLKDISVVKRLFVAADNYDIKELSEMCSSFLEERTSNIQQ